MKKLFTTLFVALVPLLSMAQYTADFMVDFEDGQIPQIDGFYNVDGTGDVVIKNDATYTQTPNEVVADDNKTVLWTDYEGYIGLDETILNKNTFSIVTNYKWTGQSVWWLGFINFVGWDENRTVTDPDTGEEVTEPGWVSPKLQVKKPSGTLNGLGFETADNILEKDVYYHVVFTYDNGIAKIYIDGALQGETPAASPEALHSLTNLKFFIGAKTEVDAATGDISMGVDGGGNSKCVRAYFDDLTVFNRTLNDTEVMELYFGAPIVTDIAEKTMENSVEIFPNPAQEKLNVQAENVETVNIFNMSGTKVISTPETTIDISSVPSGIYLIQCVDKTGKTISNQKIVIK
ncbi:T9SS type A sorting domain-containing protein [Marinilabilia rubra]|uniref:Secretion system C-terminal sorting domain-containing protein n=1 Tax=Marinilabilia rubra TaxID=2162893 RepID=A0A2U2BE61_9BACT|nr:T9SS type A sorting domain-containing protein [Marinilabilia rubra]PWE01360.1 hypothetical protein DDZ16_02425 [Marinilabilia rubra]